MTSTTAQLDMLETPLRDAGLEAIELPDSLQQPVPDNREGRIVNRAYEGPSTRLARLTRLELPAFQGFNAIVFPNIDRPAPLLGIDLADDGGDVTNFIVDLWGLEALDASDRSPWKEARAPLDACSVDWTPGSVLEGPRARLISDAGLMARDDGSICSLDGALGAIADALDAMVSRLESLDARSDCDTTEVQETFCQLHAAKPGGRDMLVDLLGESHANTYLEQLFFPAPDGRPQSDGTSAVDE